MSLVRDASLVRLAGGVVGVSFGAVAVAGGLPVWVPGVMSLVVYAGSAQFSAVGVLLAGGGPVAAAATASRSPASRRRPERPTTYTARTA